jgi:hypothetical protein
VLFEFISARYETPSASCALSAMTTPGLICFEQRFNASEMMVLHGGQAHGLPGASASTWVLVGAHYGGIDHHVFFVMIFGQQLENVFEDLSGFSNRWMSDS